MILLTSPDGNNGISIIRSLLAQSLDVKALLRKQDGENSVREKTGGQSERLSFAIGDYDDMSSLEAAMQNVDGLVILVPFHENMQRWEENLISAAENSGVGHIVKFSEVGSQVSSPVRFLAAHGASDRVLMNSAVPFTIVRVNDLMQNLILLKDAVRGKGEIYSGIGASKISWIDLDDVAASIAAILTSPKRHEGHTYDLTGPEAISLDQIAQIMTDILGKTVRHIGMTPEEFGKLTGDARGNAWYGEGMVEIQKWIKTGEPTAFITANVQLLTGHSATDATSFFQKNVAAFT